MSDDQTNKLVPLAQQIREWQTARGLSDNEMLRRFAGLGSTKTFKRILDGDLEDLDAERWHQEYLRVWNLIEIASADDRVDEPAYDDLSHTESVRFAITDSLKETGNNRFVLIEGPPGSGKTTSVRLVAGRWGRKVVLAEADETWKESLSAMLGGLLSALGVPEMPSSASERKVRLLAELRQTPVCLIIDEAHHLGPRTLNMVKTILNQTSCQIVACAIPTLWRKLETTSYEEARQITRNRLCMRVKLEKIEPLQAEKFLRRRLEFADGALKGCARAVAEKADKYGLWNFVNLVAREARRLAGKRQVDIETFGSAISRVMATR